MAVRRIRLMLICVLFPSGTRPVSPLPRVTRGYGTELEVAEAAAAAWATAPRRAEAAAAAAARRSSSD